MLKIIMVLRTDPANKEEPLSIPQHLVKIKVVGHAMRQFWQHLIDAEGGLLQSRFPDDVGPIALGPPCGPYIDCPCAGRLW